MNQTIQVPQGQLAYEVYGTAGPVLLALPGIGDTRASYRRLGPLLAEAGFTVYAMDLRGHGQSDATFTSYTAEDVGDDAVALLEALDLTGVTLVGNSVGAAASAHASLRSKRVGRIVSLSGFLSDPPAFALMRIALGFAFVWPWGGWLWGIYRKTLFATPPADLAANHQAVLENLREPGRLGAVRAMMRASKVKIAARLGEVSVPSLVLMGAQDPDFPDPAVEAQRQAEVLGGRASVVMVQGAGHYPQIEQPDATMKAIAAFVGEGVSAGT